MVNANRTAKVEDVAENGEDIQGQRKSNAIQILNGRRRPKRPKTVPTTGLTGLASMPNLKGSSDLKGIPSIVGMSEWLRQIGHSVRTKSPKLNIIHVAGTKGKGSTCAFIESFLRAYGQRTGFPRRTGLYTSPHLIYPEERIRVDFAPLGRDKFTQYFFEVFDVLSEHHNFDLETRPRYLQLFALVAFHTFIRERVGVAIFETHHGGEYDATNVIDRPVVNVITPLGMDHVAQLGPSIENIAWHKAGIFKAGARAVSAPQEPAALKVLQERALEKGLDLQVVENDTFLPNNSLSLKPDVQRSNCSVALAAVRSFLDQLIPGGSTNISPTDVARGVEWFAWPGRFQLVIRGKHQWFLDGAHNEMSVGKAAEWFMETAQMTERTESVAKVLIFSHISEQRDVLKVFDGLATSLADSQIQHLIITAYDPTQDLDSIQEQQPETPNMPSLEACFDIWKRLCPGTTVSFQPTVGTALAAARRVGSDHETVQTLVTGSQHLVGGALFLLQRSAAP